MSEAMFCDSDDVVTTRTSRHWLGKDGILRAAMLPGAEDERDDAIANVAALAKLGGGVRRPLLVDMRKTKSQKREARVYYSSSDESVREFSAVALLVKSPLSRMIANFFIGLNKGRMPIRLVNSEDEGLAWLREFMK